MAAERRAVAAVPGHESSHGEPRVLAMRDIVDGQLESVDDRRLGRVADLRAEWHPDGRLVITDLVIGPEALAHRIGHLVGRLVARLTRRRFEVRIPVGEVEEIGPTVYLRGPAREYPALRRTDDWLVEHLVRFIPGNR